MAREVKGGQQTTNKGKWEVSTDLQRMKDPLCYYRSSLINLFAYKPGSKLSGIGSLSFDPPLTINCIK